MHASSAPDGGAEFTPAAVYFCSDRAPLFNDTEEIVQLTRDMTAVLNCSAESEGPISYLWYRNEDLITNTSETAINPSGNMLTIPRSQYSDTGIYVCQATNVFDHSNKTWNLTVVGKGEITLHTE